MRGGQNAYERVFLGIAITVTVVWAIAVLVQVAFPQRQVPTTANVVMTIVATAFFGGAVVAGRRGNGKNGGNGTEPKKLPPERKSLLDEAVERAQRGTEQ